MSVAELVVTVIVVSASGVMSPGPLTFGTLLHGVKGGYRAGLMVALGHMLAEIPLVLILAVGLMALISQGPFRAAISLIGGLGLLAFAGLQAHDVLRASTTHNRQERADRRPLLTGLVLTGLNPYFIMWWLTVGNLLILKGLLLSLWLGLVIMYVAHIWMDYAWLGFAAHLAHKVRGFMRGRTYRALLAAFALFLIYLGSNSLMEGVSLLTASG